MNIQKEEDSIMKLNEKIIALRKEKGMSQVDLADSLNVSRQTVSKWENGDSAPDIYNLTSLAKLFNVTTDSLLSEEDISTPEKHYPEWLNHLPKNIQTMVHRYGWIYGAKMAVSGLIFTIFGCFARFLFHTFIFGMYSDPFEEMMFSEFNSFSWRIAGIFTGFIIAVGVVIMITGIVLAVTLKKWGEKHS